LHILSTLNFSDITSNFLQHRHSRNYFVQNS
jgi:hypothetical protein